MSEGNRTHYCWTCKQWESWTLIRYDHGRAVYESLCCRERIIVDEGSWDEELVA